MNCHVNQSTHKARGTAGGRAWPSRVPFGRALRVSTYAQIGFSIKRCLDCCEILVFRRTAGRHLRKVAILLRKNHKPSIINTTFWALPLKRLLYCTSGMLLSTLGMLCTHASGASEYHWGCVLLCFPVPAPFCPVAPCNCAVFPGPSNPILCGCHLYPPPPVAATPGNSPPAYSQDIRTMEEPPSPYDSDVDARSRMIANLNASMSGPATAETSAAAVAAAAAAAPEELHNRSFSVSGARRWKRTDNSVVSCFISSPLGVISKGKLACGHGDRPRQALDQYRQIEVLNREIGTAFLCDEQRQVSPVFYSHRLSPSDPPPLPERPRCAPPPASQINTSHLHPLNDSDSSLELTGTFSTTDELKTPAVASALGGGGRGGGSGGFPGPQTKPASYAGGSLVGVDDQGEAAGVDDRYVCMYVCIWRFSVMQRCLP